jgi:hypothetical protein
MTPSSRRVPAAHRARPLPAPLRPSSAARAALLATQAYICRSHVELQLAEIMIDVGASSVGGRLHEAMRILREGVADPECSKEMIRPLLAEVERLVALVTCETRI